MTGHDQAARRGRGRVLRAAGEAALWLAAVGGAACIVLVILAYAFDITLMLFRTGSMAPTIPAGSVAVVQRVPAHDVAVGDIVTVDRAGQLPVTHRITSIGDGPTPDERVITMRGDANAAEDPHPYTVTSVRIVRMSLPALAPVVVASGDPFVLGGVTVGAALLVGWAFWPRAAPRDVEAGAAAPGTRRAAREAGLRAGDRR